MCGICGYVHRDVSMTQLEKMNTAIFHRGPNSAGYYEAPGVALAMRRLSIIDVSGGDQPIFNEDRSILTVFNGEMYNFLSLRERLRKAGHQFQTQTDTECIVHAYETWGIECLQYFNGMFAFALWDTREQRLFIARDRTGSGIPANSAFLLPETVLALNPCIMHISMALWCSDQRSRRFYNLRACPAR